MTCTELHRRSTPLPLSEPRKCVPMTLSAEEMETESQMLGLDSLRETKAAQLVSSSEGSKGDCISVGSLLSREEFNRGRRQGSPPLGQQTLRPLASDCDTCKQQPGSTHPLNQLAAGFLPSKQKKKKSEGHGSDRISNGNESSHYRTLS